MGQLIVRNRVSERARVWYWRARYWWMDTENGREARIVLFCATVLFTVTQWIRTLLLATALPEQPVQAIYPWVIQLIIAIVMAVISYALAPKVEAPPEKQQDMPTVEDGQAAVELHGDGWIKDEFIMAQQVVGKEPIKGKGKK